MQAFTLKIPPHLFTEDSFLAFCELNDHLKIERDPQYNLIIMTPTNSFTGNCNSEINLDLGTWNRKYKLGRVFDSSTGFTLADNSILSPDASWIANDRWDALSVAQQKRFAPICPDFVIELRSPSDSLSMLKHKMVHGWLKNGCQLAWLIDPKQRQTHIYKAGKAEVETRTFRETLSGENILPKFTLELHQWFS